MKALRFDRPGKLDVLSVQDVPRPTLAPGEVLVEVHAAAINPSDVKNIQGAMPQTTHPRTPGRDFAGVVVEGPKEWLGAEVFGTGAGLGFTRDGTHAEYLAVPADALVRKPPRLSMAEAAGIGVPFVAAWDGLMERCHLLPGQTVLVVGGTGAVGGAVSQLARWSGARVIATALNEGEIADEWRRSVDVVIDLSREDLLQATQRAAGDRGVDVVYNAVGGSTFAPSVKSLGRGGRLVAIAAAEPREVSFNLFEFYRRDLAFHGLDTLKLTNAETSSMLRHVTPGFESGALHVRVSGRVPLDKAREAYEQVSKGTAGKIVLVMR